MPKFTYTVQVDTVYISHENPHHQIYRHPTVQQNIGCYAALFAPRRPDPRHAGMPMERRKVKKKLTETDYHIPRWWNTSPCINASVQRSELNHTNPREHPI